VEGTEGIETSQYLEAPLEARKKKKKRNKKKKEK
jgi:hypothetical protein